MKIIQTKFSDETLDFTAQTIGFFDGVHLGHRHLIEQVKAEAEKRGLKSMVITFREHPKKVLCPQQSPKLLTTLAEKLQLLEQTGIDYVALLDFTPEMSNMSAREFMGSVLRDKFSGKTLVIGYDHHFGRRCGEGFADYKKYGDEMGINVVQATEMKPIDGQHASSSAIRKALETGDMDFANRILGYPYSLEGVVGHGEEIGQKMGFPTANILLDNPDKLLPCDAGYAVKVTVGTATHPGMLYIGRRPTFEGLTEQRIEVNIIDFNEEIYGQHIKVELLHFLRGEQHFDSMESLSRQLQNDLLKAKQLLNV